MFNIRTLLSTLILYKHNTHILHWKVKGIDFDPVHSLMGDYYNQLEGFIDDVAEMGMQIGLDPVMISEALDILEKDDSNEYLSLEVHDYSSADCFAKIDIMFNHMITLYDQLFQDSSIPASIVNVLQEQQQWFRKEGVYKNKQRLK